MTTQEFTAIKNFCKENLNHHQKAAEDNYLEPATNKQVWFIASLCIQKGILASELFDGWFSFGRKCSEGLTKYGASLIIETINR